MEFHNKNSKSIYIETYWDVITYMCIILRVIGKKKKKGKKWWLEAKVWK